MRSEPHVVRAGFSVAGPDWRQPETDGIDDPQRIIEIKRRIGYEDAALAHRLGGRMLRVPFSTAEVLGDAFKNLFGPAIAPYRLTIEERIDLLDRLDEGLRQTNERLGEDRNHRGDPLKWHEWDAYLEGVETFNAELGIPGEHMEVLMVLVEFTPMLILEAPSTTTLKWYGRSYSFESLWHDYVRVHIHVMRKAVRHFVTQSAVQRGATETPAVTAIEIMNEPDYTWLPTEMRIEYSLDPAAYPGGKYLTELHQAQIPTSDLLNEGIEPTPWGFRAQDMHWHGDEEPSTDVLSFRWGRKFNRYVAGCADLMKHLSFAARDEGNQGGARLTIVSGSVTHANVDYLIRLYRADPDVFRYVDKVGIHPYHWPEHDIWRTDFVSENRKDDWRNANPRDFAKRYFKRFDFLEEIHRLTRTLGDSESFGLAGKPIWITEFGVPTKKMGRANRGLESLPLFIYQRGEPAPDDVRSIVWEEKWDVFLGQVDRTYLTRHGVEVFLVYTLREGLQSETSDDEHSNFALYRRDGTPRMDAVTHDRFLRFFESLSKGP